MGKGYSKLLIGLLWAVAHFVVLNLMGSVLEKFLRKYTIPLGGEKYAILRLAASFLGLPRELGLFGSVFAETGTPGPKTDPTVAGVSENIALTDRSLRSSIFAVNWETSIGPLQFNWSRPQQYLDVDRPEYFSLNLATRF